MISAEYSLIGATNVDSSLRCGLRFNIGSVNPQKVLVLKLN